MPKEVTPDLDGWKPVLCEYNEMPTEFFEHKSPKGNIAIFEKDGLWYVRKDSAEHIADGVPYCEADKKIFETFDIHVPDADKMLKYGVRVCG
jgi:hypothetical protein